MDNRESLHLIMNYLRRLPLPSKANKRCFEQDSYARWATIELYQYVNSQDEPAILSVEKFVALMDKYACMGGIMFSVAYDISVDILDNLLYN
jgi:hypothetical protein